MRDPIIRVEQVWKRFTLGEHRVEALRGANLLLDEPGFYAIMGASGSGKSTLLHLLAGLDRPDVGSITVAGHDLNTLPERALTTYRRLTIGIIFQQFNLIPTLSALQNVALPGMLDGRPERAMEQRATEVLTRLGLEHRAHHRPDALSGGEQQRVAIARALLFQPRVVFADEPTGNLDSESSNQLWELLGALAEQDELTVLMVTHEPAAASHCRRTFTMSDGVIKEAKDAEDADLAELSPGHEWAGRSSHSDDPAG